MRAATPPTLDGRDDDAVWRLSPAMTEFRQFDPGENLPATFRTEARVAYDDRNLYVLVRAFDPHPDSIASLLSRRDVKTASDQLKIIIDAYKDGRTGVEMAVNPAGVKRDHSIYNDVTEDATWDGVWDVDTRIDSAGWVAEFRVPFSQLRFTAKEVHEFGFGVWRDIARLNQRDAWPAYRPSQRTLISQLGTIVGITDIGTPRRIELLPYAVTKSLPKPQATIDGDRRELTAGLDLKAGLGSHLTVDGTVNPDFGQVEADPAVLNLTAFEIRFDERRPFFQEGAGLYKCNGPCEGMFYTRRIGRTPQLRTSSADPMFTRITAAAKLTGRFSNGISLGLVDASTERVEGVNGSTIEPQTNYLVLRALRELRGGRSQFGLEISDVRRQLDASTEPLLRRSATTALAQGFHRFARDRWEVNGYGGVNEVRGSANAIALTQRNSVHLFQRPDHEEAYDPTRTVLDGHFASLGLRQVGGRLRYETNLRYVSAGPEFNDLGFVNLVNDITFRQSARPATAASVEAVAVVVLHGVGRIALDHGRPLGGPDRVPAWQRKPDEQLGRRDHGQPQRLRRHALRQLRARRPGAASISASRAFASTSWAIPGRRSCRRSPSSVGDSDEGRSWYRGGEAGMDLRIASRFSTSLGLGYDEVTNDQQWIGNYGALLSDTTRYTFARLHQHIMSVTARANWTATPTLSFQLYLQPFVSTGDYDDWRELDDARAADYDARFASFRATPPPGFNVKQFNSNAVLRWEYRPASTVFLVWQQGRAQSAINPGTFVPPRDVRDLFGTPPLNTLLLKVSYWFNP